MKLIVEQDYDGYFERLTKQIVGYVRNPKYKEVVVTSGPYRLDAVSVYKISDDAVRLDYYAALRKGFGTLTEQNMRDVAKLLEKGE